MAGGSASPMHAATAKKGGKNGAAPGAAPGVPAAGSAMPPLSAEALKCALIDMLSDDQFVAQLHRHYLTNVARLGNSSSKK